MASSLHSRTSARTPRGRRRHLVPLRVALALTLPLLTTPFLGAPAVAEPTAPEVPAETLTETGTAPLAADPPAAQEPPTDPAAEEPASGTPEAGPAEEPAEEDVALTPLAVIDGSELQTATYRTEDEDGANDVPGQVDVTQLWSWSQEDGVLRVAWSWDEVDWSGNNTGDACALFDTDEDGNANFAVCVTIDGNPAVQVEDSPRVYQCKDTDGLKCFDAEPVTGAATTCEVGQTATDPFAAGAVHPDDTTALCEIVLDDVGAGDSTPRITNVCSYPSQIPNSNPFDCVLAPRDALLTIKKVLVPEQPEAAVFDFTVTTETSTGPRPQTVSVSSGDPAGESFGIASGRDVTVEEVARDGWELTGAVCTDGTVADPPSAPITLNLRSGAHVTCTFTNARTASAVVDKVWVVNGETYAHGDPALAAYGLQAQLTLTGPGAAGATDQAWGIPRTGYLVGDTVTIDESAATPTNTLCTLTGSSVTAGGGAPADLPYDATLGAGPNAFTVTNTVICGAELQLVKLVGNGPVAPDAWSLSATGPADAVAGPSGTSGVSGAVTPGAVYDLAETGDPATLLANYVQGGEWACTDGVVATDGRVSVPAGVSTTCTVTNLTAELTLRKHVVNDSGGAAQPSDFTLTATPEPGTVAHEPGAVTGSEEGETVYVRPGVQHTLAETGVDGYALTSLVCERDGVALPGVSKDSPTFTPQPGDRVTCTFTNDDVAGELTLLKTVDNGATGATTPDTAWTLKAEGPTTIEGAEGDPAVTAASVPSGTYSLSESGGPAGYTASTWACTEQVGTGVVPVPVVDGDVAVGVGERVTCEITNTAVAPTLTLVKSVLNDHGGTSDSEDWTLTATPDQVEGQPVVSGPGAGTGAVTARPVRVGTYALTETGPSGYDLSSLACVRDGGSVPGTSTASPTVTLGLGDDVSCTFTNDDRGSTLTLRKVVEAGETGSEGEPADWTLTAEPQDIAGQATVSGVGDPAHEDGVDREPVFAGRYELSEAGPGGYTAGSWVCSGATTTATVDGVATVTVPAGADVVCEITNTADMPHLTLVKDVVNGASGATAAPEDWTLSATPEGGTPLSGAGGLSSAVKVGTYTLAESGSVTGYTASAWSCRDARGDAVEVGDGDTVTLAAGDDVSCTITNTAVAPELRLVKIVDNGETGSDVRPSAWWLSAARDGEVELVGAGGAAGSVEVGAYDLDETAGPAGYRAGDWVCTNADGTPAVMVDADTVLLGAGADVTCTITNTAQESTLTLVKVVEDNGAGGRADPADWTLTADGPGRADLEGAGEVSGTAVVGDYALSESGGPDGYEPLGWRCVDQAGDAVDVGAGDVVSVGLGDHVTCTITNRAIAPRLTLVKDVENGTSGATYAPQDWRLVATGPETLQGDGSAGAPVRAGSYTLSESGPEGYDASGWDCRVPNGQRFAGADGGTVTLELGDDVTCTITNTAVAPQLTLVKVVDNGTTGRIATATDWTLSADGEGETGISGAGGASGTVPVGDYALAESTGPAGYAASAWQCTAGAATVPVVDGVVTLGLGDVVTCTITNTATPVPPPPPPPPATASVKVLKVDAETGRAIDTAKFRLWRDTGSTAGVLDAADTPVAPGEVATGTAGNAVGSYTWTGLGQGGYLLQETAAPTGYQLADPAVTAFTLTAADLGTTVTKTVRNPQKRTAVRVVKVDDETGETLAGAVFQAYVDDGDTAGVLDAGDTPLGAPVASDGDGVARWSGLRFGSYLLEEVTAPEGYALPAQTVQAVTVTADNAGGVVELRFLDPALGTLAIAKAAFEADGSGGWLPSDGRVEFGDTVRYVVTATATGPRILRDVVVTDYVPGHDPADTTSTTTAEYVPGSAACVDEGPCAVDFDAASQLVTWELGDLRDESRRVEIVVEFPPARDDAVAVDGIHRAVLANVAAASWTDRSGDHTVRSDEVVVDAVAEILPTEEERPPAPPVEPRPPAILPETGAPAGNGTLSILGGILLAVGALLMARRRRDVS